VENTFTLLGGRLTLTGPRPPEDALWLAASVPTLAAGTRFLDAGTGIGTAALGLLARQPQLVGTGVEINPDLLPHATQNATRNNLTLTVLHANILTFTAPPFPLILSNPPFHATARGHHTPNPQKALAHSLPDALLTPWLTALTQLLAPQGQIHLILHTACQKELTTFAQKAKAHLTLTPLQTSPANLPKRLLAILQPHTTSTLKTNAPLPTFEPSLRQKILGEANPLAL
jgi:tRNA1(Val) A37 N6-methylase TrmN6